MSRSLKKGPYLNQKLEEKIRKFLQEGKKGSIKTWSRSSTITPEMVGISFLVHNGKEFISVSVREEMVGHKLGEFSPTTRFQRHGGRMERELEKTESAKQSGAAPTKSAPGTPAAPAAPSRGKKA